MATVEWTDEALAQLDLIFDYIHQFHPPAADRMITRLIALAMSLETSPGRGRPVGNGCRELVAVQPDIIRYRVSNDRVDVLRVRHSARDPHANN